MEAIEPRRVASSEPLPWPDTAEARSGSDLADRVYRRLNVVGYLANGLGGLDLFLFLLLLGPATITASEFDSLVVRAGIASLSTWA